ncbi:MAG: response regulator [Desulfobacteraceae bacterium]|nr:MAG: response regulator [Desulfobacteraceae bacterium]
MSEKILIVDDELDMLELLELIITDRTSYQVVTVSDPLKVPELLQEGDFDLLISDLRMPQMDGMELLDRVRQIDSQLPYIILTAYGTVESAIEAMRKGALDYITKPFRQEQILLTVEKALKFRRLQKENLALKKELETLRLKQQG